MIIYLHGSYAECKAEVNKVINIVKFRTIKVQDNEYHQNEAHKSKDHHQKGQHHHKTKHKNEELMPYAIVVKSGEDEHGKIWVPFVSITSKWEPPKDPKELNKTLFMAPPDESSGTKGSNEDNINTNTNIKISPKQEPTPSTSNSNSTSTITTRYHHRN